MLYIVVDAVVTIEVSGALARMYGSQSIRAYEHGRQVKEIRSIKKYTKEKEVFGSVGFI